MTKRVLITRPAGQADHLCGLIEAAGAEAVRLPAIEIRPLDDLTGLEPMVAGLDNFQLAVFVSVNAVHAGLPFILARRSWPENLKIAAIGPSSTAAIHDHGLSVDYVPQGEFSSEGLLAVKGLQDMWGKKAIIFRGNGGRSKLYETLTARGAEVAYAEVYSRGCPVIDYKTVIDLLQLDGLDTVTAASNETLQNLFVMAGPRGQALLRDKLMVVPGKRQLLLAKQLGCTKTPIVAGNASDEAMMAVLEKVLSCEDGG